MPIPSNATEVLDREFLEVRAKLLEIAAALDRLDRAAGSVADDPRIERIRRALEVLQNGRAAASGGDAMIHSTDAGRAEQIQLLFSLPYDENWQKSFALGRRA